MPPDVKGFYCYLCNEKIEHPATDAAYDGIRFAMDHFRNIHPEIKIETWPDGGPVIVNKSDPDFGDAT